VSRGSFESKEGEREDVFASGGRRAAARAAADAVRQQAAGSFLALDEEQRSLRLLVEAYAGLDAGPAGAAALEELRPLLARADAASEAWIAATDRSDPVTADRDAEVTALRRAEEEYARAGALVAQARDALAAYRSRRPDLEDRVQRAWSQVAPRVAEAQAALESARATVAELRAAGLTSRRVDAALRHAEELARPVAEGPHRHGVAATLRASAAASAAARDCQAAAERLRELAAAGPSRLTATATRLDGVAGRLEHVPATLSRLRRTYSSRCSADLDPVPTQAGKALDEARALLARARGLAAAGSWEEAAEALSAAREHVADADRAVSSVIDRERDLEAVVADPRAEKQRSWFAVRDAQRLVLAAGDRVPRNETTILDNLAARLDRVDEALEVNRPDWWAYLGELRAVREIAAGVVRRTRAAMAESR
jgi:hypothetical protein